MKKIVILIGNYGSGKTEIALNMAFLAAAEGKHPWESPSSSLFFSQF